mmetsp:Transcript_89511/g.200271  ORF Transcript_89511/g.200271 Transcript_89511/m.200271 type:complete len:237 (+) Transcript_89511:860-1570(+)
MHICGPLHDGILHEHFLPKASLLLRHVAGVRLRLGHPRLGGRGLRDRRLGRDRHELADCPDRASPEDFAGDALVAALEEFPRGRRVHQELQRHPGDIDAHPQVHHLQRFRARSHPRAARAHPLSREVRQARPDRACPLHHAVPHGLLQGHATLRRAGDAHRPLDARGEGHVHREHRGVRQDGGVRQRGARRRHPLVQRGRGPPPHRAQLLAWLRAPRGRPAPGEADGAPLPVQRRR